jgi:hypothetical protein
MATVISHIVNEAIHVTATRHHFLCAVVLQSIRNCSLGVPVSRLKASKQSALPIINLTSDLVTRRDLQQTLLWLGEGNTNTIVSNT